jgi:hypothetical protein
MTGGFRYNITYKPKPYAEVKKLAGNFGRKKFEIPEERLKWPLKSNHELPLLPVKVLPAARSIHAQSGKYVYARKLSKK